ncbi:MAG: SURF1 family protein [Alphaproteobacteria bacterium]
MVGFRPRLWPTVATVPALAILVALGTWQMQRLAWKTDLLAARDAALAAPPVPLDAGTSPDDLRFRRGEVTGTFDHAHELYLGPRVYDHHPGVHVLTPLRLADGAVLLVNRGWVPQDLRDAARRPAGQVEGVQTVRGVVLTPGPRGTYTPDNEPANNQWFYVDLDAMGRAIGAELLPFVLASDDTDVPGGVPIGGQGRLHIKNDHLQYALTWYSLAVVLLVIYVLFHRRSRSNEP